MKTCVIVDAYRYSNDYIHYISNKHIQCVHVQSTPSPLPDYARPGGYHSKDYIANLIYNDDLPLLLNQLKPFNPIAVIAGTEPGVKLADILSNALHIKPNDHKQSKARRDKYEMIAALNYAGIPHMKYCKVQNSHEALHWISKNTHFPVVVKPLESAGTDDVFVCANEEELKEKIEIMIGKKNSLGNKNDSVLVQEFLHGTEYMVNSVSCHGKHYFTDIWRCHKRYLKGQGMVYDRETLMESQGEIQTQITAYLIDVLKALGIQYGGAHAELILTDSGPILIEVGSRIGGNVNCNPHTACLGVNQLELAVDAYLDETAYEQKTRHPYTLLKHMTAIVLSTQQQGIIKDIPLITAIKSCRSLYWYRLNVKVGDMLKPTRPLYSSPGEVFLLNENSDLIEKEYHDLMRAMENGFVV
jgi:biotin carboxylase